ncbi:MAG: hypothetical protein COV74_06705, partial [Candidatus Omnitrophica bacterium CG11_big_fil_rev_8_21_14_0_20_45_26]
MVKRFQTIAFPLLLGVMVFQTVSLAAPPPTTKAAHLRESDASQLLQQFLFDLYNGLIGKGFLDEVPLTKPAEIWKRDFDTFKTALKDYHPSLGSVVTAKHLYYPTLEIVVTADETNLFAEIRDIHHNQDPPEFLTLAPRTGLLSCEVKPVDQNTKDLAFVVGGNAQCLFAQYLSQQYKSDPDPDKIFGWDYVLNSNVDVVLNDYLFSLKQRLLLDDYEINLENGHVFIDVIENTRGLQTVPVQLSLGLVSIYEPEEEAQAVQNFLQNAIQDSFVYLGPREDRFPSTFSRDILSLAIQEVIQAGADAFPWQKKDAFLSIYGLQPIIQSLTPQDTPHYPWGTVTPLNAEILYIKGSDHNGAFSKYTIEPFLQRLAGGYGYHLTSFKYPKRGDLVEIAKKLKSAQTIGWDAHGKADGSETLACLDIPYGRECCEAVKEMAQELGLDTSPLICNDVLPAQYSDRDGIIFGLATGDETCPGGTETNRCLILLAPKLYDKLGEKGAVFTSQCYGGACANQGNVMDFFSESTNELNYSRISSYDTQILGDDLLGKTKERLICTERMNQKAKSPECQAPPPDMMYGWFRTVQASVEFRGTSDRVTKNEVCQDKYVCQWGVCGVKQYCKANVGGVEDTLVEFAPTVTHLSYGRGNYFTINFSSPVKPGVGSVDWDDSACQPRLAGEAWMTSDIQDRSINIEFQGYPMMERLNWLQTDPEIFRLRYGHDQNDWPWMIKVKVNGVKASNGIPLDGNSAAALKWVFPMLNSSVEPWQDIMGAAPAGDTAEFWLPCLPPIACCLPNVEQDENTQNWYQNGCSCTGARSIDTNPSNPEATCYVETPDHQIFEGETFLWHECCDKNPEDPNGEGVCNAYTKDVLEWCDENQTMWKIADFTYHHREYSMDRHEDEDCETIRREGVCPQNGP